MAATTGGDHQNEAHRIISRSACAGTDAGMRTEEASGNELAVDNWQSTANSTPPRCLPQHTTSWLALALTDI